MTEKKRQLLEQIRLLLKECCFGKRGIGYNTFDNAGYWGIAKVIAAMQDPPEWRKEKVYIGIEVLLSEENIEEHFAWKIYFTTWYRGNTEHYHSRKIYDEQKLKSILSGYPFESFNVARFRSLVSQGAIEKGKIEKTHLKELVNEIILCEDRLKHILEKDG